MEEDDIKKQYTGIWYQDLDASGDYTVKLTVKLGTDGKFRIEDRYYEGEKCLVTYIWFAGGEIRYRRYVPSMQSSGKVILFFNSDQPDVLRAETTITRTDILQRRYPLSSEAEFISFSGTWILKDDNQKISDFFTVKYIFRRRKNKITVRVVDTDGEELNVSPPVYDGGSILTFDTYTESNGEEASHRLIHTGRDIIECTRTLKDYSSFRKKVN